MALMEMSLLNADLELGTWNEKPGETLIPPGGWDRIAEVAELSERELQVGRLIFQGLTRAEVAERLGLSPRTVRHYMEMLHLKLRVSDRIGLVLRFVQIRDHIRSQSGSDSMEIE